MLDELGIKYSYLSTEYNNINGVDTPTYYYEISEWQGLSEEEIQNQKDKIKSGIREVAGSYQDEINNLNQKIESTETNNKGNWNGLLSSVSAWLSTEGSYNLLNDDMQSIVQSIINKIDFSELDFSEWEDVEEYIYDNILQFVRDLSPKAQQALSDLFAIKPDDKTVSDYINAIKAEAQKIADNSDAAYDEILEKTGFQEIIDTYEEQTNYIINSLRSGISVSSDADGDGKTTAAELRSSLKSAKEWLDGLSSEDFSLVYQIAVDYDTASWALEDWKNKLEECRQAAENAENKVKSLTEQISEVGKLSDGFDKLSNIYKDVADGGSFDVSSLFTDDFAETFSGLGEAYDNFIATVAGSPDDIAACQSAFDDLATAYINNSGALEEIAKANGDDYITVNTFRLRECRTITISSRSFKKKDSLKKMRSIYKHELETLGNEYRAIISKADEWKKEYEEGIAKAKECEKKYTAATKRRRSFRLRNLQTRRMTEFGRALHKR